MSRTAQLDQQTIENINDNPLKPLIADAPSLSQKTPFKLKDKLKDPKIKLLFILVVVMAVLLLLTLIAALLKKKPTVVNYQPTPTTIVMPTPSINQTQIPDIWAKRLNDREDELKTQEDFLPPQIDTDIGL